MLVPALRRFPLRRSTALRHRALPMVCLLATTATLAGCSAGPTSSASHRPAPVVPVAVERPIKRDVCRANGFDCDMRARIVAVDAYLASRPGVVGYVLRDRVTGGVQRNAHAETPIWTASTIKLAMAADLLTRNRNHAITLNRGDYARIDQMLHTSDDTAADTLWYAYSGPDHRAYNNGFRGFGMSSLAPQAGFSKYFPYWGFQKCTAADLDRLMDHVLTRLHPADRSYLVDRMRRVDPIQQWGVWGAGPGQRPGNKDGWSQEQGGWVVNSVGFAGPGERYTLSIMNALGNQGGFQDGSATDTRVAQLLFAGR